MHIIAIGKMKSPSYSCFIWKIMWVTFGNWRALKCSHTKFY